MNTSKYIILSMIMSISTHSALQSFPVAQQLSNGNYIYQGKTYTPTQWNAKWKGKKVMPMMEAQTSTLDIPPVSKLLHEIDTVRTSIVELIDTIARNNEANKIQLLKNILKHEQQSLKSLQAFSEETEFGIKVDSKLPENLRGGALDPVIRKSHLQVEVPNWAGCPYCD